MALCFMSPLFVFITSYYVAVKTGSIHHVYCILYLLPIFTEGDMSHVNKNLTKKRHNIWYEARLLPKDPESSDKAKRVYVYISPKVSWTMSPVIKQKGSTFIYHQR